MLDELTENDGYAAMKRRNKDRLKFAKELTPFWMSLTEWFSLVKFICFKGYIIDIIYT